MSETLYNNLSGDNEVTIIESLCVNCEEQGTTRLLLTKIPFFQEVILMSFSCENCGYTNSELQPGGQLKDKGSRINLRLTYPKDLDRDVVKSEHAVLRIPELDFEIPATAKKGSLNTIEGLLQNIIDGLEQDQEERKQTQIEVYEKIQQFIPKLENLRDGKAFPFHLIIDDPSGNSFIKNPHAPNSDPEMKSEKYYRTKEQCEAMGYDFSNAQQEFQELKDKEEAKVNLDSLAHKSLDFTKPITSESIKEEGIIFETPCHNCHEMGENKMCTITIPYFKELVIMSFSCDFCGAKSRDIKTGGEVSEKAKKITMSVDCEDDLKRDVFKSETALLQLPELEIELLMGTLGGMYSSIEGLLNQVKDHLSENNPFFGDSDDKFRQRMQQVLNSLQECIDLKRKFTIILDDPLGNSFIQNPNYPEPDPKILVEVYARTEEQNDDLGLNHMKTENY